jgi:hypothetical protein
MGAPWRSGSPSAGAPLEFVKKPRHVHQELLELALARRGDIAVERLVSESPCPVKPTQERPALVTEDDRGRIDRGR